MAFHLTPEQCRLAQELAEALCQLDPSKWDVFLKDRCADPTVREAAIDLAGHALAALEASRDAAAVRPCDPLGSTGSWEAKTDEGLPDKFGGGRFSLVDELGKGGFGCVGRYFDKSLSREVAVKFFSRPAGLGDHDWNLVVKEARNCAKFEGVVPVHDVGEHDGRPYIVFEYMERGPLADLVKQFRSPRRAAELVSAVASVVAAIHVDGTIGQTAQRPRQSLQQWVERVARGPIRAGIFLIAGHHRGHHSFRLSA